MPKVMLEPAVRKVPRLRRPRRRGVTPGAGKTSTQTHQPLQTSPHGESARKRLDELARRIRVCVKCPLHTSRTIAVPGEGKPTAKVMIIGEAPGKQEDQTGRPFVGNAGRYLEHVLEGTTLRREDFFITNIVKCRPPSNRTPKVVEVETCTSLYLFEQITLLGPKLVLLLGSLAVKKMLGLKSVEEARGRFIEHDGRKYLASYHPAVRFYREDLAQKIKEDFALVTAELMKEERTP